MNRASLAILSVVAISVPGLIHARMDAISDHDLTRIAGRNSVVLTNDTSTQPTQTTAADENGAEIIDAVFERTIAITPDPPHENRIQFIFPVFRDNLSVISLSLGGPSSSGSLTSNGTPVQGTTLDLTR